MGKRVNLKSSAGITKEVKIGFSWTTFFFGMFVPLVRGDIKWAVLILLIGVLAGTFTLGIGTWVAFLIFAFKYNELYIKDLIEKGYSPVTAEDAKKLDGAGIISEDNFKFDKEAGEKESTVKQIESNEKNEDEVEVIEDVQ